MKHRGLNLSAFREIPTTEDSYISRMQMNQFSLIC
jgi:hypothetical protein